LKGEKVGLGSFISLYANEKKLCSFVNDGYGSISSRNDREVKRSHLESHSSNVKRRRETPPLD
jgi:hypothetical protein